MSRRMPRQKPGLSETVVRTPPEFLAAAKRLLGIKEFAIDLAACDDNAVAPVWITKEMDSLSVDWAEASGGDWCWLNPPYDDIATWAAKCLEESKRGARIAFLVPSSTGTNWWDDFVHKKALVKLLKGRIQFLDKLGQPIGSLDKKGRFKATPFPKDLVLILFGAEPDYDVWAWKPKKPKKEKKKAA